MERLRHGMIAVNRQAGTAKTGRNSQPGSEGNSTRMLRFVVSDGLLRAHSGSWIVNTEGQLSR